MDIERMKLLIIENLKAAAVACLIIGTVGLFAVLAVGVFYFGWFLFNEAPDELRRFVLCVIGTCITGYILYAFFGPMDQ